MMRANRPILAFFDAIKALRVRQLALILKAGFDPNLMLNARGQNGLQFMINYFNATDAHYRLQAPINKSAYLSTAKLLLDSGLDPNATDLLTDETVLFDAIRYNDREMVSLLLNYVSITTYSPHPRDARATSWACETIKPARELIFKLISKRNNKNTARWIWRCATRAARRR